MVSKTAKHRPDDMREIGPHIPVSMEVISTETFDLPIEYGSGRTIGGQIDDMVSDAVRAHDRLGVITLDLRQLFDMMAKDRPRNNEGDI